MFPQVISEVGLCRSDGSASTFFKGKVISLNLPYVSQRTKVSNAEQGWFLLNSLKFCASKWLIEFFDTKALHI